MYTKGRLVSCILQKNPQIVYSVIHHQPITNETEYTHFPIFHHPFLSPPSIFLILIFLPKIPSFNPKQSSSSSTTISSNSTLPPVNSLIKIITHDHPTLIHQHDFFDFTQLIQFKPRGVGVIICVQSMSVERSFEAWEEVQRQGLDLADRLTHGFTDLIHSHITPPSFNWPNPHPPKFFDVEFHAHSFAERDFRLLVDNSSHGIHGVSAILDIGNKLGQVGADFGASLNGVVQQFFRRLPVPFRHDEDTVMLRVDDGVQRAADLGINMQVHEDLGTLAKRFRDFGFDETEKVKVNDDSGGEEVAGLNLKGAGFSGRSQGILNFSTMFDSRTCGLESSLAARGDIWRIEASNGSLTSGNMNSSLFLVQLGPVLFIRDSTLLLPVHLSKKHLLWYGYDRKNGMHSLCPAVWSKHRRWLLMSMLCLNPMACSFMDLQFPNGQLTYVAGEGITTSAFLPVFGGLLQAQGQYPGEMKFSFSCKNKWGTRITPMVQWPAKSFTLGFEQALAWKRSGLMVRPTVQISLQPTIGGSNPGLKAELVHSLNEELSLIGGCSLGSHPYAFASLSIGRSKWNGNVGKTGVVFRAETPLTDVGRPSFSVQLNSGIEF